MGPYIVRFVSKRSGVGKTFIASKVVEKLVRAGYSVGVIKHSVSSISLEEKDSSKYLTAGALKVAVASREIVLLYNRALSDVLSELVNYVDEPLIIVEGFKNTKIGDNIVIAESLEEAVEVVDSNTIAIVVGTKPQAQDSFQADNVPILFSDQIDDLTALILKKAEEHFKEQLPGLNCGICGLDSCGALAQKILKGDKRGCPAILDVKLLVNDREVPLNPFVKNMVSSVIEGLIGSLKGTPHSVRRVLLEINKK